MNKYLYEFEGIIWQMLTNPAADLLIVELRDEAKHQVSFAAIDLRSDKILWKDVTFAERWWIAAAATDGNMLVLQTYLDHENPQHKSYFAIDVHTLKVVWESDTFQVLKDEKNKNLHHPFHYPETNTYFDTVKQFMLQYTNTEPIQGCEYLEYKNLIFIAYYLREGGALANYLLVVDTEGQLHLQERLDQNLQQIGLGTFFIAKDKLILIKEKNQLVSYAL